MNINIEYNKRKQKEKAFLSFYTVHPPHTNGGRYNKSRTRGGGYVAWPNIETMQLCKESKRLI